MVGSASMIAVGPIQGYLPFRIRVQRQDFRVALDSGETALLTFRDVVNNAFRAEEV